MKCPELVHEDQGDDADRERRPEEQRVEPDRDDHGDQGRSESAELDQNEPVLEEGEQACEKIAAGSALAATALLARRRRTVLRGRRPRGEAAAATTRRRRHWWSPSCPATTGRPAAVGHPEWEAESSASIMARPAEPAGESLAVRCAVSMSADSLQGGTLSGSSVPASWPRRCWPDCSSASSCRRATSSAPILAKPGARSWSPPITSTWRSRTSKQPSTRRRHLAIQTADARQRLAELRGTAATQLVISIIAGATTTALGDGLDHPAVVAACPTRPPRSAAG